MKYLSVLILCYMLFVGSVIAQKEWKVAEIGGADSVQGPYKLEKKVEFLDNGFITNATGGDIWGGILGCTLVYMEEKIKPVHLCIFNY